MSIKIPKTCEFVGEIQAECRLARGKIQPKPPLKRVCGAYLASFGPSDGKMTGESREDAAHAREHAHASARVKGSGSLNRLKYRMVIRSGLILARWCQKSRVSIQVQACRVSPVDTIGKIYG